MIHHRLLATHSAWALLACTLAGSTLVVHAQQAPAVSSPAAAPQPAPGNARTAYVLGVGDQIVIRVTDVPDINDKPQRVDQDGDVRLPIIGRLRAAGLTLEQFERDLTERLKVYLQEPDVAVTVTEAHSESISVIGAVATPGIKQLEGGKTLLEVLAMAGGPNNDAGPLLRITRKLDRGPIPLPGAVEHKNTGFSMVEIPLKPLMDARAPEHNIPILPNDVIAIPPAEVVYVIGEVGKAGSISLTNGNSITVMEAISASGGALRTASPGGSRILRLDAATQQRAEIPVDISKIMQGKGKDVTLFPGDILVVPDSKGKRALPRALEAALQAGLLIGTYSVVR